MSGSPWLEYPLCDGSPVVSRNPRQIKRRFELVCVFVCVPLLALYWKCDLKGVVGK